MAYGILKCDTVTFTDAGVDKSVTLSGLVQNPTFSGNVTVTGTLSGVTVTGTTANFTSGNFTNISGGTHTITSGVFAAGSAASPSITFTGDLNTGIYSPGADQVAISTGGSGRLFVDASGNVSIGAQSSSAPLVVTTTAGANIRASRNSKNLDIIANYGGSNERSHIHADSGMALTFGTGGDIERLRITSAGLVGVGTSSPQSELEVVGNTADIVRTTVINNSATGSSKNLVCGVGGATAFSIAPWQNSGFIESATTNGLALGASSATGSVRFITGTSREVRATIDSSGRLGVGTTSASELLHVNGNALVEDRLLLQRLQSSDNLSVLTFSDTLSGSKGNNLSLGNPGGFDLLFHTGGVEKARIDSSGRLGIGTSSPSESIHTTGKLRVGDGGNYTVAAVQLGSSNANGISYPGTNILNFITNSTAALTIDASQRVGIGTTSPGTLLDLRATSKPSLHISDSGYTPDYRGYAVDFSTIQQTAGIDFATSSPSVFLDLYAGGSAANLGGWNGQIRFFTGGTNAYGTERARIDSSGRLLVGTSSSRQVGGNSERQVQIESTTGTGLSIFRNSNDDTSGILTLGKSRGTSNGSSALVQNNDYLGIINFVGADGTDANTYGAQILCQVDGTPGADDMPGRLVFSTTADGESSPTERMRIEAGGVVRIPSAYSQTTANAANLHVLADGSLVRSTSSAKYKTDVETIQNSYADALLQCRPVWYRSTCECDNPDWGWWGLIAEEVAAIDPRLVHWKTVEVSYDKNGSVVETPCEPEPEGVQYDRFVPHLLNLIKRQQQAIETLEAKVAAFESA